MAKIKRTMTVSLEEFGKKAGEYALDEFEYNGLTIRQWADKITSGEYQPVKHGRWIEEEPRALKCSQCGNYAPINDLHQPCLDVPYCPWCGSYNGARKDGDSDD